MTMNGAGAKTKPKVKLNEQNGIPRHSITEFSSYFQIREPFKVELLGSNQISDQGAIHLVSSIGTLAIVPQNNLDGDSVSVTNQPGDKKLKFKR